DGQRGEVASVVDVLRHLHHSAVVPRQPGGVKADGAKGDRAEEVMEQTSLRELLLAVLPVVSPLLEEIDGVVGVSVVVSRAGTPLRASRNAMRPAWARSPEHSLDRPEDEGQSKAPGRLPAREVERVVDEPVVRLLELPDGIGSCGVSIVPPQVRRTLCD